MINFDGIDESQGNVMLTSSNVNNSEYKFEKTSLISFALIARSTGV